MYSGIGFIAGLVGTYLLESLLKHNKTLRKHFWENHKSIFGYHLHHSIYGVVLLTIGVMLLSDHVLRAKFLISFGVGITLMHTITEKRLIFVEKIR